MIAPYPLRIGLDGNGEHFALAVGGPFLGPSVIVDVHISLRFMHAKLAKVS